MGYGGHVMLKTWFKHCNFILNFSKIDDLRLKLFHIRACLQLWTCVLVKLVQIIVSFYVSWGTDHVIWGSNCVIFDVRL